MPGAAPCVTGYEINMRIETESFHPLLVERRGLGEVQLRAGR